MYGHILIAVDGSEVRAEEQGLALAKALGSQVTLVHATEPWPTAVSGEWALAMPLKEYQEVAAGNAKAVLAAAAERARRYGVACKTEHIPDRYAAEGILDTRKQRRAISSSWARTEGGGFPSSCSAARRLAC